MPINSTDVGDFAGGLAQGLMQGQKFQLIKKELNTRIKQQETLNEFRRQQLEMQTKSFALQQQQAEAEKIRQGKIDEREAERVKILGDTLTETTRHNKEMEALRNDEIKAKYSNVVAENVGEMRKFAYKLIGDTNKADMAGPEQVKLVTELMSSFFETTFPKLGLSKEDTLKEIEALTSFTNEENKNNTNNTQKKKKVLDLKDIYKKIQNLNLGEYWTP